MRRRQHHKAPPRISSPVVAVVIAVAFFVSAFRIEMNVAHRYAAVTTNVRAT